MKISIRIQSFRLKFLVVNSGRESIISSSLEKLFLC